MTPGAGIFRTTLPTGFSAGGVNSGVRRYRPDLGVIISEVPSVVTGVFTQNASKGAPIKYCQGLLPSKDIKAIITNSGQANAATGRVGDLNNQSMVEALAVKLACSNSQVLTASTGVIGEQMSIDKIVAAIPNLVDSAGKLAEKFAVAILTTDLVPKTVHKEVQLSTGKVTITGICKGSGMIHPNMATMLGYILTDATLSVEQSQQFVTQACDKSFNMISVDGDTSTNDCVFLMSNGMSGVSLQSQTDNEVFYQAVEEVATMLAISIARDGEGASRLIQVTVDGVPEQALANTIARSLTTSPLIKTAIYGESPNWGRIISKIGENQVTTTMMEQCEISIQQITLFANGLPIDNVDMEELARKMKYDTIDIDIRFKQGDKKAIAWGCDLTEKYVEINADYLT